MGKSSTLKQRRSNNKSPEFEAEKKESDDVYYNNDKPTAETVVVVAPKKKKVSVTPDYDDNKDDDTKATLPNNTDTPSSYPAPTEEELSFQYHIFTLLFMNGNLIHQRRYDGRDLFLTGLAVLLYNLTHQRFPVTGQAVWALYLFWCLYGTLESSPHNANHHNMCGLLSLVLLPSQLKRCYLIWKKQQQDKVKATTTETNDDDAQSSTSSSSLMHDAGTMDALNTCRLAIIWMYLMAGFHKLNTAFFDPNVSCAYDKIWRYFEIFGGYASDHEDMVGAVEKMPFFLRTLPHQVLIAEFVPPILLLFSKLQRPALVVLIALHTILLPVGFSDFGSIAQSFLLLFASPHALVTLSKIPRHFYGDAAVVFVLFEFLVQYMRFYDERSEGEPPFVQAEVAMVFFCFAMVWGSFFRTPNVPGPKVYLRPKSWFGTSLLLFFVWFTWNPYLGLRSTGVLTMFSNLQTEGPTSNHLLLGSNPLKMFSYQDDWVHIKEIDERLHFKRYDGEVLPRMQWDMFLHRMKVEWEEDDEPCHDMYVWLEYQNQTYESYDAFYDEAFSQFWEPRPYWQRKYMLFRAVEVEEPKTCTW